MPFTLRGVLRLKIGVHGAPPAIAEVTLVTMADYNGSGALHITEDLASRKKLHT